MKPLRHIQKFDVVITKRERERSAWERDRSKNPSELDIERNQQKQEKQNKATVKMEQFAL